MKESSENWLTAFEEYAKMKRWSANTIKVYSNAIKMFKCAFHSLRLKEISDDKILAYLLKIPGASNRCTHHSAIKCLYQKVFHYPFKMRYIEYPEKEYKLPYHVTKEDFVKLMQDCDNIKHRCILMLAFDCGMRVSEIVDLKIAEINSQRMEITIRQGKGRKDRIVNMSSVLLAFLRSYYGQYKPQEYLFNGQITYKTHDKDYVKYSIRSCQNVFKYTAEKAGLPKHYSIHKMRHGFAMSLWENGTDKTIIRDLLGHKSIETTEIYARMSNNVRKLVSSPLEQIFGKEAGLSMLQQQFEMADSRIINKLS